MCHLVLTVGLGCSIVLWCFFFKQKTAYEMRISDWSSDVCSSDLAGDEHLGLGRLLGEGRRLTVDRCAPGGVDRTALVDRLADHVDDAAEHLRDRKSVG